MEEFENEEIDGYKSVNEYLNEIEYSDYYEMNDEIFRLISEDGLVEQLEEVYNETLNKDDFEYMSLELTDDDSEGLMNDDDDVVDKFNVLSTKIKKLKQNTYDLIDYDNGVVYIINLK